MSGTTEQVAELQDAIQAGIVTVPVAPWEKIHLTGEQYIALTSNAEVLTSSDVVRDALPFPISLLMMPLVAESRQRLISAIFTYDEAEVEAAIRKHCPEVTAEYDAGLNEFEVARKALDRANDAA